MTKRNGFLLKYLLFLAPSHAYACAHACAYVDAYVAHFAEPFF